MVCIPWTIDVQFFPLTMQVEDDYVEGGYACENYMGEDYDENGYGFAS